MATQQLLQFKTKSQTKTKVCTKCGEPFPATSEFFNRDKSHKDGFASACKMCRKAYYEANKDKAAKRQRAYREANRAVLAKQRRAYREANKDKLAERKRAYYEANKDKLAKREKAYSEANKDKVAKRRKAYREANKDKVAEQQRVCYKAKARFNTYNGNKFFKVVEQIRPDPSNTELLQVRCAYCNRWFNPANHQVRHRINAINVTSNGENRFYCSDNCKLSCPIYKQRKYPKGYRKATSREAIPSIRQMVLKRDDYKCQHCGKTIDEAPLHAHHITPATQNPVLACDIGECITLCKSCHKAVHKKPGCGYHELKCQSENKIAINS